MNLGASNVAPCIYRGTLRHRRFRPVRHEFTYSTTMVLLDVDRIEETMAMSRLTGYNRTRWASYFEKDHFGDAARPLRERLAHDSEREGVPKFDGPIYLLTHLRYWGYCFNPISLYYCGDRAMAEVNSTFGESRNYWLGDDTRVRQGKALSFACKKALHVSPFMGMNLDYEFVLTAPGDTLVAHINTLDGGESFFDATLTLERQEWTSANLARALAAHPLMSMKVIAAIHWEALRLWMKGAPVYTRPA